MHWWLLIKQDYTSTGGKKWESWKGPFNTVDDARAEESFATAPHTIFTMGSFGGLSAQTIPNTGKNTIIMTTGERAAYIALKN